MDKLTKTYEAVEMLRNLGLPISGDLLKTIAQMEKEYLTEEVLPLLKQELEPMVSNMQNNFQVEITFDRNVGLNLRLTNWQKEQRDLLGDEEERGFRRKKFIIRVTFPDKRVSCHKIVTNTFIDVIKYAGLRNVERLGIMLLGDNLVSASLHENEKYRAYQQEIEPGLYVCTYCNTERKLEILKTVNRELNLNLTIEKVMI